MTRSDALAIMFFAVAGLFFGAVLFGWAAGCGEHYIDAYGQTHYISYAECLKGEQQ